MASKSLQMIVTQLQREQQMGRPEAVGEPSFPTPGTVDNTVGRLCWGCFLLECDMLAELHLPRSGIELVIDTMPFPGFTDPTDRHGLSFLAICSIRRLLNRIHRAIYAAYPESTHSASPSGNTSWPSAGKPDTHLAAVSLGSICAELSRQLDTWYDSLPAAIKPDLYGECRNDGSPRSLQEGWLRCRYWSARHIISRPCLLYAVQQQRPEAVPPHVLHYSEMCIEACRRYIKTSSYMLCHQTHYNWMTIQA